MPRAMQKKILVVEDDKLLSTVIQRKVTKLGYDVYAVYDGDTAFEKAPTRDYSLIICDIALPTKKNSEVINGFSIVDKIRNTGLKTPIIIITNNNITENEMLTYLHGANIFHKKPINFDLLCIQVRKLIEDYKFDPEVHIGDISIDPEKSIFKKEGIVYDLTRKEFSLMLTLVGSPGEVFSRKEILSKHVTRTESEESSVDITVSRLRKKLGKYKDEEIIETVHGRGFRLNLKYLE